MNATIPMQIIKCSSLEQRGKSFIMRQRHSIMGWSDTETALSSYSIFLI